jgi:hypothetical protein
MFVQNGIAMDAGPASGGGVGTGISELGLAVRGTGTAPFANAGTGPYGTNFCDLDAPATNPTGYHYLCFSPNAQGGGLIAYGAGGTASQLPFQFIINGTSYNLTNNSNCAGVSCPTYVANNAALRALTAGVNTAVIRGGFAAAGDAPPLLFTWQATCPGTVDNLGYLVQDVSPGSGCYQAQYTPGGIDPREWGAKLDNTTDDTAAFTSIDTACTNSSGKVASVAMPTGYTSKVINFLFSCLSIRGEGPGAGFAIASGAGPLDTVLRYTGTGPVTISGLTVTMPIYNFSTETRPNANYGILIEPGAANVQVSNATITNNRVIGGTTGISVYQTINPIVSYNWIDRPWAQGINVASETNDLTIASGRWQINDNWIQGPGNYGITIVANSSSVPDMPSSKIEIKRNVVVGGGYVGTKYCYDVAAHNWRDIDWDNAGYDCRSGLVEFKQGGPTSVSTSNVPADAAGLVAHGYYSTSIDQGSCADYPTEGGNDDAPGEHRFAYIEASCVYQQPVAWQTLAGYSVGAVRYLNGNLYMAVQAGESGATGPSGTGKNIADGTVIWDFRQPLPTTQKVVGGLPAGGIGGSGYAVGDVLTVSGGTCVIQPTLYVTKIDVSGQVLRVEPFNVGTCSILPTNPVSVTGGGGASATFNLAWNYVSMDTAGSTIDASNDLEMHLHMFDMAEGAQLQPRGGTDQTIRRLKLYVDGTVNRHCVRDAMSTEFGTQATFVDDAKFMINCTSYGQASNQGAIYLLQRVTIPPWAQGTTYWQNDLVTNDSGKTYVAQCATSYQGCLSGNGGGPTGTGNAIVDGGVTWNYSTQAFATSNYTNLQFIGGAIRTQGTGYAFTNVTASGGITMSSNGTNWTGGNGAFLVTAAVTATLNGGTLAVESPAAAAAPIALSGAGANSAAFTLMGHVVATSQLGITSTHYLGYELLGGTSGTVVGLLDRGVISGNPTGLRSCAAVDFYYSTTPTNQTPSGWQCTTPSATAASTVFTSVGGGVLTGTSPAIGGGALGAGVCANNTVTISGVDTTWSATATPVTYPGDTIYWKAYVSGANTVTVKVCSATGSTPTSSTYVVTVEKPG